MKKVYCKNCKFNGYMCWCNYKPMLSYRTKGSEYCGFRKIIDLQLTTGPLSPYYKDELNLNGECQYYQPTFFRKIFKLD